MNYSTNELNNILKTLPVGYYLKRNVTVEMDESAGCSYYDPMNDKICISFKQLSTSLNSLKNDTELEENVRTLLYHEVSHAFITPKELRVSNVMNIFEDERIESVLRHYYMNTNFREFVKRINNYHGEDPDNAESAFYHLVRYRVGDKKWLDELHELIIKYANLTRGTRSYTCYNYQDDVNDFHNRFVDEWNKNQATQNQNNDKENEEETEEENQNGNSSMSEGTQDSENETEESEQTSGSNEENEDADKAETEMTINSEKNANDHSDEYDESLNVGEAQHIIEKTLDAFRDTNLNEKIFQILAKIANSTKKNGSAINSYSGVFDPRSVARDDYRYFVQKNRLGHVKAFSKTKLNLFIDCSGSFSPSETLVNKLLYALSIFERQNPDFSYDVVKCSVGEELCKKNERQIACGGGNRLDGQIFQIFNSLQDRSATVYNIVLFDGDAFTNCYSREEERKMQKNFGAFNFSNVTIISDLDNQTSINKYCKSAKKIFTRNYANELIENVLNTLQLIAR